PAGVERDDHLVQLRQPPAASRDQPWRERPVPIPRDPQLDIADAGADRLRERPVARVREQRRLRVAPLITDVIGQLRLQPTLQAPLDQLLDQPVRAVEVDLARIDPREQIIHHPRLGQTPRALLLSLPTRLTRHLVDHQLRASFHKETHPLHTPFDTPDGPIDAEARRFPDVLVNPKGDRKSTRLNSSHVKIAYAV